MQHGTQSRSSATLIRDMKLIHSDVGASEMHLEYHIPTRGIGFTRPVADATTTLAGIDQRLQDVRL